MFKSILPLLAGCKSLSIIVVPTDTDELTVTVIPTAKKDDENTAALNTPLSLTGTAEELDARFAELLAKHAANRASLDEQYEATASIMEAAKKDSGAKAAGAVKKGGKAPAPKPGTASVPSGDNDGDGEDDAGTASSETPAPSVANAAAGELNLFA